MNPCCWNIPPILRPVYEFDRCIEISEAYFVAASLVEAVATQKMLSFQMDEAVK